MKTEDFDIQILRDVGPTDVVVLKTSERFVSTVGDRIRNELRKIHGENWRGFVLLLEGDCTIEKLSEHKAKELLAELRRRFE